MTRPRPPQRHRSAGRGRRDARLRHRRQRAGRRAAARSARDRRGSSRRSPIQSLQMTTLYRRIDDPAELANPQHRESRRRPRRLRAVFLARADSARARSARRLAAAYRHIGLYAYRRSALLVLAALEPTPLERAEALEQLRALEHGIRIKAVETTVRLDRRRHAGRSRAGARRLLHGADALPN